MAKVVTMGELLLRLTTPGYKRFIQAESFDACYGGGEANVAVSLAYFGHNVQYVTKVPDNPIGHTAIAALKKLDVGTDFVAYGGNRLGIYFCENGAAMRPSNIVYDRKDSSIATAVASDFDFDAIFEGVDWFHFTGITPAISDEAAKLTEEALIAAKKHNVTVSVDLNYRKKLWSTEKAKQVMSNLMKYVDVCIGNEEDADKVLGFKAAGTDVNSGNIKVEGYEEICKQMVEKYNFKYVLSSLRESRSASDNGWSGCLYSRDDQTFIHSKKYDIHIVDRVGGGDSFAGGFIAYILDNPDDYRSALEYAVAGSALAQTIPGDANLSTKAEIMTLMNGNASGRVQR